MIPTERINWEVHHAIYEYFWDNKKKHIPSERMLHSNFGVSLHAITVIWTLFSTSNEQWEYTISALHLLWTLYYLKTYPSCDVAATFCRTDEKTFRKYTRYMILEVFPKVLPPIDLDERFEDHDFLIGSMIVDGTDLMITKRAPPPDFPGTDHDYDRLWFSFKHRCSAIKYEVGVHFRTGRIVWINGPKKGAMNDITMARSLLTSKMRPGEMALADRGYVGDEHFVTPMKGRRNPLDITLEQLRCHVERVIGRIKFFDIVRETYRGSLEVHPFIFDAVCRIVNINIDEAPIYDLPPWEFGSDFDED